jgi:flagellar hook-basal body complex protein FliE
MNMRINSLQSQALAQLAAQRLLNPGITAASPQPKVGGIAGMPTPQVEKTQPSFSTAFKDALTSVSAAQHQVTAMQNKVQMGAPDASLEETMVSMQKAQIGFQTALNVRNRMVQAYSDIMNMQV